jgi:hypothetical protein
MTARLLEVYIGWFWGQITLRQIQKVGIVGHRETRGILGKHTRIIINIEFAKRSSSEDTAMFAFPGNVLDYQSE